MSVICKSLKTWFVVGLLCQAKVFSLSSDPLNDLNEFVQISSGTSDIAGVNKVLEKTEKELKELGFETFYNQGPKEMKLDERRQLVAEWKNENRPFMTFIAHADTVFETLTPFKFSDDKKKIFGSGVGDNKGGIVFSLHLFKKLIAHKEFRYSLRFIVSPTEETGSLGFREKLSQYAQDSNFIFGMEPALMDGSIVHARKGVRWYHIKVSGVEAHAGTSYDEGANACLELSQKLNAMFKLSQPQKGNTISIGHMKGGKEKFNIVCGEAEGKVDFRFVDQKSFDAIHPQILKILKDPKIKSLKDGTMTKIEYTFPVEMPPYALNKRSQKMVDQYLRILSRIEKRNVKSILTGGGADLNFMASNDKIMMDGLGPIGGQYHTVNEYIEVDSFSTRLQALEEFLTQI